MNFSFYLILVVSSLHSRQQAAASQCQDPTDVQLETQLFDINTAYFWFLASGKLPPSDPTTRIRRSFRLDTRKQATFCDQVFTRTEHAGQYPKQGETLACSPSKLMEKLDLAGRFACEPVYEEEICLFRDNCQVDGLFSYRPFLRQRPLFCQLTANH